MRAEDIRRLEALLGEAWPATETASIDGWRMGFSGGASRRANSVLMAGPLRTLDLDEAIDVVEARYRQRGLAPCFKMTRAALPSALHAALDARGYRREGDSQVLTGDLRGFDSPAGACTTRLSADAGPDWLDICLPGDDDADAAGRRAIVRRLAPPRAYALASLDGRPAGAAAATAHDAIAVTWAVRVEPWARRRGVARSLMAALAAWARSAGARRRLLQVEAANRPARALYAALGMTPAYAYHYRILAAGGPTHGS